MPQQSKRLALVGLGVENDTPPVNIQPPLPDGIHLRWAFTREDGFPWYGFFLFRRRSEEQQRQCILPLLRDRPVGTPGPTFFDLSLGEVTSDLPLHFTDDFPPPGVVEIDLGPLNGQGRTFVRFALPVGGWAIRADVRVGFRDRQETSAVVVTATLGGVPVGEQTLTGAAGHIVSASFEADGLDAIVFAPANGAKSLPHAALVDLCLTLHNPNLREGWQPVPRCPHPLALPITHPDYPASGAAPVNQAAAEATALGRITYGSPAPFGGAAFHNMHDALLRLVQGGPGGPPMADPSRAVAYPGIPTTPEPGVKTPSLPATHPLDLVLLSSIHPAVAQMLGLYWLDRTTPPGAPFDYLIIADYANGSGLDAHQALTRWLTDTLQVEGYVLEAQRRAPAPPLAVPTDVRVYALPGSTLSAPGGLGVPVVEVAGLVGVRWNVPAFGKHLLPGVPLLYHLWRDAQGDGDLPGATAHTTHLTASGPILVVQPPTAPFSPPQWPPDWPELPMHRIDRVAQEGWYGYRASGMDLFGRISAPSAPGAWWQWSPPPSPRPWYYLDPPGDQIVFASAVRVLDKTPPPPPAGVEATLLDPADPFVVQDTPYLAWRAAHPNVVGLRVKWRWRTVQMRQAPDMQEFRLYFNPGTDPPSGSEAATAWQMRCHVTGFADNVTVSADGSERLYDVLLPIAGAGVVFAGGVPLSPTLTAPVVYANVAVTAADGAPHTPDAPQWAASGWGNRPGNESRTTAPAKIVRVKRDKPAPPPVPPDSERVFATPADYYARSYWTVRLTPIAHLGTHVYRALDASLFEADWKQRPRPALDKNTSGVFPNPADEPRWDDLKRQQVADELNHLNTFPQTAAGKTLALAYYKGLSNDGLRVLAGLAGTEAAFTQITSTPLPDTAMSYRDTLDGRATNRYFYRTATIDGASNRSSLSLSGPPIYLPNVMPPRPPTLTRVLGGERQITLTWASNREEDLAEYRVYRADSQEAARDLRAMTLIHTEPVAAGDPAARPASVSWTDDPVPGLTTFYYVVTAIDDAANESDPSAVCASRAHDEALPVPPMLTVAWVEKAGVVRAEVTWTSSDEVLLQRLDAGAPNWIDLAQWRPAGTVTIRDPFSDPTLSYTYRLIVRKATGAIARGAPVILPAAP
jgi:hypothetical protein